MREAATDYNFAEFWIVMNKLLSDILPFPWHWSQVFSASHSGFLCHSQVVEKINNTRPRESAERKSAILGDTLHISWVYIKSRWTSIGIRYRQNRASVQTVTLERRIKRKGKA